MHCYKLATRIAVMIVLGMFIPGFPSSAQQSNGNDLYQQTSEMADMMINYDADKTSIMSFYSTGGQQQQGFGQQQGGNYNSPERRKRLLLPC
jgi:hypothetical protein